MPKTKKLTKISTKKRPAKRRQTKRRRKLNRRGKLLVAGLIMLVALSVGLWAHQRLPYWLYPTPYYAEIVAQAQENDLDPLLVLAIAKVESGFNPEATSPVGAVGIMQVMPDTAAWLANRLGEDYRAENLAEVEYNIHLGTEYLRFLLNYWDGDIVKAIASYNAGQAKVADWLNRGVWDGTAAGADNIPYEETRDYVKRVLAAYQQYNELY